MINQNEDIILNPSLLAEAVILYFAGINYKEIKWKGMQ